MEKSLVWYQDIVDACPLLFDGYCTPMACGPGWHDLIKEGCLAIEKEISTWGPEMRNGFAVTQIKEKFGTLRFYTSFSTDKIDWIIDDMEQASARTCEDCGELGTWRRGGWCRTLCDKHAKEMGYEVAEEVD